VSEERQIDVNLNAPRWTARPLGWLMKRLGAKHTTSPSGEQWKLEKELGSTSEPDSAQPNESRASEEERP
jgi:hypothetical protein